MSITISAERRRLYRLRHVRSRPDQALFDGTWRQFITASLARRIGVTPKASTRPEAGSTVCHGDPRTSWTPATPEGEVWPQPARGFA